MQRNITFVLVEFRQRIIVMRYARLNGKLLKVFHSFLTKHKRIVIMEPY